MLLPQLHVHRDDHGDRTLITFAGEIDLATVSLVRATLTGCVRDGIRTVDVDLVEVTFCDVSGLNVFLAAFRQATYAGTALRLHRPPSVMARAIEITGSGFLLHGPHVMAGDSRRTAAAPRPVEAVIPASRLLRG
ncbi:STAS domain-containing protein [Streptomyces sp. NBC_00028]|uniref:STAS domain-containing protein n=1 Tax=Streptomyces sp. NBC_00028 TaxID=2975624 RepID=UPI00324ADFFF